MPSRRAADADALRALRPPAAPRPPPGPRATDPRLNAAKGAPGRAMTRRACPRTACGGPKTRSPAPPCCRRGRARRSGSSARDRRYRARAALRPPLERRARPPPTARAGQRRTQRSRAVRRAAQDMRKNVLSPRAKEPARPATQVQAHRPAAGGKGGPRRRSGDGRAAVGPWTNRRDPPRHGRAAAADRASRPSRRRPATNVR